MERAGAKAERNGATRRKGAKIPPINRRDSPPIFFTPISLLSLYHHPPSPAAANCRSQLPPSAAANRRSSPPTFFSYATREINLEGFKQWRLSLRCRSMAEDPSRLAWWSTGEEARGEDRRKQDAWKERSHFPVERDHHSHPSMVAGGGGRISGSRLSFFSDVLLLVALRPVGFRVSSDKIKPPPPPCHGGRWWWVHIYGLYAAYGALAELDRYQV
ncbi:hypothetical protein LXL04_003566 [Taraxacum kok-saghyz]